MIFDVTQYSGLWLITANLALMVGIFGAFIFAGWMASAFSFRSPGLPVVVLIFGLVMFFGGTLTYGWCNSNRPYEMQPEAQWDTTTIQNITSLSDGQSFSVSGEGHFFLGSGSITVSGATKPQYVFYKIMPQGYQIGTLDATNVYVRMDEQTYPYIEWTYHHTQIPKKTWIDNGEIDYVNNGAESSTLTETVIHVPNGTIIKEYNLDGRLQ